MKPVRGEWEEGQGGEGIGGSERLKTLNDKKGRRIFTGENFASLPQRGIDAPGNTNGVPMF
jgi:hypothetical protein